MNRQRRRTATKTANLRNVEYRLKTDVDRYWREIFRRAIDGQRGSNGRVESIDCRYQSENGSFVVSVHVDGREIRSVHSTAAVGVGFGALDEDDVETLRRVLIEAVEDAYRVEVEFYRYSAQMRHLYEARRHAEMQGDMMRASDVSLMIDRTEHRWMRTRNEMMRTRNEIEQRENDYRLARAQQQEAMSRQMAQQSNDWIERQLAHQMRQFQRQDAVNWYVNQDFADAFGWPYGGDPEADARGIKLLRENLTKAQLAQYDAKKYFDVTGSATGKTYRIKHGRQQNIIEYNDDGKAVALWCFLPTGGLCAGDCMLAQKVALETDEKGALKIANRFHTTAPDDPSLVKPRDKHSKPSSADEVITRKRRDGGWYRRMGNRMGEWW